jgi:hypothetical protein
MQAKDARVLVAIGGRGRGVQRRLVSAGGVAPEDIDRAVANLVRLGLVEWRTRAYTKSEIEQFTRAQNPLSVLGSRDVNSLVRDIEKDVRQLKTDVLMQLQRQQQQELVVVADHAAHRVTRRHRDGVTFG